MKLITTIILMLHCSLLFSSDLGSVKVPDQSVITVGNDLGYPLEGLKQSTRYFTSSNLGEFNYNKFFFTKDYEVLQESGILKNRELLFPQYIPEAKKAEILKLYDKIIKMCPECSQAPIIVTENPIKVPPGNNGYYVCPISPCSYSKCGEGKEFDSSLAICVKKKSLGLSETNTCDIPAWFERGITRLEKVAKYHAVELSKTESECKRKYVLLLIDTIEEAVKE